MVVPEERSSACMFGSDLELNSISEWLSSVEWSSLVNVPGLTEIIVAVVEDNMSPVSVNVSMYLHTFSSVVLDVSSGSTVPSSLNSVVIAFVDSDNSSIVDSELNTSLVSKNEVSSHDWSDGLSS
jgi:hypothetical protein